MLTHHTSYFLISSICKESETPFQNQCFSMPYTEYKYCLRNLYTCILVSVQLFLYNVHVLS